MIRTSARFAACVLLAIAGASGSASAQDTLEQELIEAAKGAQSSLPIKIDDTTSLTGVEASGKRLTYVYAIDVDSGAQGVDALQQQYQALNEEGICGSADIKKMLMRGVDLQSRYVTKDGKTFTTRSTVEAMNRCP